MLDSKELKFLIKPITILLVLIALIVAMSSVGYSQIKLVYEKVSDLKATKTKLDTKLNILESVESSLSENITFVDVALPNRPSIIYGLAQVKKLGLQNGVLVSNLKAGSATLEDNGISKYSINFEAEGSESSMQSFLLSFYKTLPIMNIDKVKIDKSGDVVRSTVSLYVYFADLPEKIPAITESINGLSAQDIEMINELSTYTLPDFFDPKPSENAVIDARQNPFN